MTAREFRGNLYLFVDRTTESKTTTEAHSLFDQRAPGQLLWFITGHAVSRNSQSAYCARTSLSKLRCFATFSEAMDLVRKKRKARPQENFYLVYDVDGRKSIVTSLEQIRQLEGQTESIQAGNTGEQELLERLAAKVGKIVAANALTLHTLITREGEEVARSRFSNATYERLWQVLCEGGVGGDSRFSDMDKIASQP